MGNFIRASIGKIERWAQWRFRPGQRSSNSYVGIYRNFADAQQAISRDGSPTQGFNSDVGASLYRDRMDRTFAEDYPILFWVQAAGDSVKKVFDFGGHIGLLYYACANRLHLPASVRWCVSDVPAVIAEGERMARERGAHALHFSTGFSEGDGAGVWLSSGALQYLEPDALFSALASYAQLPRHLILNKLPASDGEGFVTVQDMYAFKNPYTVFSRSELVSQLERLGYVLRDCWTTPGHHCLVWRNRERSIDTYSGFYFENPAASAGRGPSP